jgi:hypothetical protein
MVEAVSIFDINGKLLLTYPYFQSTINTDGLAKGMYFIKISLPKQEISHKFVVK